MRCAAIFAAVVLLSCAEEGGPPPASIPPPEAPPALPQLQPTQRLLRASMALRGVRPTANEYAEVQADETAYPRLVDRYLASPAFGRMIRQHFTEWMELDQAPDTYPAGFPALGVLGALGTHELNTSIIEAAGRLAQHVVVNDRPWSEILTADYTLADEVVATVWGIPYDDATGGWQVTRYADGRPAAGVLSDGWVFTRMPSTEGNRHRERASLIANALICHDYPNRPVAIPPDLDLTSEAAIANAIEDNVVCVGCHHTLDPLASFFSVHYALRIPELETQYPLQQYTPEAAAGFEAPSWYGQPASDLAGLGRLIAEDPRFSSCAVRRFYSELMHIPVEDVPLDAVLTYLSDFRTRDMNVRALLRAIVLSDEFGAQEDLRKATPQQLDSAFEELTGYRWVAEVPFDLGGGAVGRVPLMRDYLWGYRTMAGGPNNFDTTAHQRTADPTTVLVLKALAERAALHAVDNGTLVDIDAEVSEQLVQVHLRLFGEVVTAADPQIERARRVFEASGSDRARAWQVTLTALFQDPRLLFY